MKQNTHFKSLLIDVNQTNHHQCVSYLITLALALFLS